MVTVEQIIYESASVPAERFSALYLIAESKAKHYATVLGNLYEQHVPENYKRICHLIVHPYEGIDETPLPLFQVAQEQPSNFELQETYLVAQ